MTAKRIIFGNNNLTKNEFFDKATLMCLWYMFGCGIKGIAKKQFLLNFFKKTIDKLAFTCYNSTSVKEICECAGTGRQARLRGVCLRRMGSSPITRTRKKTFFDNEKCLFLAKFA